MGWFIFDVALVGVDWGMIARKAFFDEDTTRGSGAARAGKLARAVRIIRLLRLMRLAKLRHLLFTIQSLIDSEWLTIVFAVSRNLFTILALNHYLACGWFAIGNSPTGWVTRGGDDDKEFEVQYLISLHWSMAQFTPGASPVRPYSLGER